MIEAPGGARRQAGPTLVEGGWFVVADAIDDGCTRGLSPLAPGLSTGRAEPWTRPRILASEVTMETRSSLPPIEAAGPHQAPDRAGIYTLGEADPTTVDVDSLDDPKVLQILSTEHWSLLASRSMTWNESFSRTGLFLSVLSASVVALGLVGGATQFGESFSVFALVLLPVTLFVGVATYVRLDEANMEDTLWVAGMNRIRHAYVRIRPGIEPFLITGWTDDMEGVGRTFLMTRTPTRANTMVHQFVTTPGMVAVIDGVLAASIAGIVASTMRGGMGLTIPIAVVVGVTTTAILFATSMRRARRVMSSWHPRFPLPPDAEPRYRP
jgi:hypothetical protein